MSGFGRDNELEADSLGAQYLLEAGYDPAAVIDVITVLKNQEDFNRLVAGGGRSYHGLLRHILGMTGAFKRQWLKWVNWKVAK